MVSKLCFKNKSVSVVLAAILDFPLPVPSLWFYSVYSIPMECLTTKTSLGAEMQALQWYRPPSWIFTFGFLPLWLDRVDNYPIGMPNPENIGIAVEITLQSCLGAEIRWESIGPHSAIYVTFIGQPDTG